MATYLELTNELLREMNEVELTSSNFTSAVGIQDRKSTRLNSSHLVISYAVFCLKKKNKKKKKKHK